MTGVKSKNENDNCDWCELEVNRLRIFWKIINCGFLSNSQNIWARKRQNWRKKRGTEKEKTSVVSKYLKLFGKRFGRLIKNGWNILPNETRNSSECRKLNKNEEMDKKKKKRKKGEISISFRYWNLKMIDQCVSSFPTVRLITIETASTQ